MPIASFDLAIGFSSIITYKHTFTHYISIILTAVDCGNLTNPTTGQVSTAGTTFGQTATYSCDAGYNLMGSTQRTCQVTGVWSGSAPTCQSMLLLELEYLVHAYPDNALLKNVQNKY